jgi:hypothetical protein
MDRERIDMLVQSYGLEYILEALDMEPSWVLEYLVIQGEIEEEDLNDIFE